MVLFTSDLHLGHKSIAKYRTPFKDTQEHDEFIFQKIEELTKRDILFVLGDFLFEGPMYEIYIERLKKINCRIKLIMGNHDAKALYKDCIQENSKIEIQLPLFSYKNMWLSHAPIHPSELRNRSGNVHGHLHLEKLPDSKYFNVNLDVNDYNFVNAEHIKEVLYKLEKNE